MNCFQQLFHILRDDDGTTRAVLTLCSKFFDGTMHLTANNKRGSKADTLLAGCMRGTLPVSTILVVNSTDIIGAHALQRYFYLERKKWHSNQSLTREQTFQGLILSNVSSVHT